MGETPCPGCQYVMLPRRRAAAARAVATRLCRVVLILSMALGSAAYLVSTSKPAAASTGITGPPPTTIPVAPTGVSATPGDGQATVSWNAPSSGATISTYTVTSSSGQIAT